eukprot:TRINITY_DN15588_c0_g1_i1.p1 TRINITY_DN15588_c0_g1~~TRINITY_DN15588_c0_g1_i1.p1  ORF type:complete len:308 (+),score=28.88 TRINITY_DN15588_c0_g1_i1:49-972(+)
MAVRSRRSRSRSSGRRRSKSPSHRRPRMDTSGGFHYSKTMAPAGPHGVRYPSYDEKDRAPEDINRSPNYTSPPPQQSLSPRSPGWRGPVVRGSLRIEGINYSKYESIRGQTSLQRGLTNGIRDDIISEAGNGTSREDILLRLSPGPIKTVVLDYDNSPKGRSSPSLVDADWCIDVEYVIETRSETAQLNIARSLYEALSRSELQLRSTSAAYVRYVDPDCRDGARRIRAVPCTTSDGNSPSHQNLSSSQHHNPHLRSYSPLGRYTAASYSPSHSSPVQSPYANHNNMSYVRGYSPPRSPTGRVMYKQ